MHSLVRSLTVLLLIALLPGCDTVRHRDERGDTDTALIASVEPVHRSDHPGSAHRGPTILRIGAPPEVGTMKTARITRTIGPHRPFTSGILNFP